MTSVARQPIAGVSVGGIPIATANAPDAQEPESFPPGSHGFTAPRDGLWKFVLWGPGGRAVSPGGGASGSYAEKTAYLRKGDVVAIVVGVSETSNTTVTLPSGAVVTAGRATLVTPGTATGGDVNLSGAAPNTAGSGSGGGQPGAGGSNAGAGAPGALPYRGGTGATGLVGGHSPGGGGAFTGGEVTYGGSGLVLAVFVRS